MRISVLQVYVAETAPASLAKHEPLKALGPSLNVSIHQAGSQKQVGSP